MTEKELHDAQNAAFERYYNSADRNLSDKGRECAAFLAGWSAADAFADKLSQPEQQNHIPDATKMVRTQAAIAAMQGLLSNPDITHRYSWRDIAGFAITNANCLLAELDKTEEK